MFSAIFSSLSAVRNPTRTWVFFGFGVAFVIWGAPVTHQDQDVSERISAPLCRPWHLMPQKTVSARRLSMKKKLKSCGYLSGVRTPASANPLLAHRRGVSGSPTYGRKIQV